MDKTTRTIADQIVEGGDSPDNHDEMETNILPSTCADPEVLRNDNYADWSARMKNCLLGQGLWDIVETTMEPPTPEDDVIEFEAWNKNNDAALHAIQSSCGMDILSCINKISSAKIAWIMLGKMFMGSNGSQDKLILTTNDDSIIDGGKSSNSDNMGSNGSHDKLILTTNDDSIIDEGKSSNPDNPGIHISLDRAADQFRLNIQSGQQKTTGSVQADHLWHQLVSSLLNLLGFKRLYEMKLVRLQFQELLSRMCKAIPTKTSPENRDKTIAPSIFRAISKGNFEFVYHIVKAHPDLLVIKDVTNRRSIFQWAVLHRQHRIFNLIYNLKKKKFLLNGEDVSKNSILHTAGMLTEHTIDHIRGATLQMQREVQWFKEVEHICPLSRKERLNKDKLTARQLFTRNHQDLRKEGEQWMKGTATSCTVVGALIITIMFAAAFTIPGGNNQDTGLPILVHDKLFTLFIVTDYMSLFSSSTSVLMFLGILTSRYAEEDFLISLPRKMILGLFALFFSIATMMIAFSTALVLMLRGKFWIIVPIIGLTGVPIILFVLMQFRLLIDMFVSTYRSSIFDRKTKAWF